MANGVMAAAAKRINGGPASREDSAAGSPIHIPTSRIDGPSRLSGPA